MRSLLKKILAVQLFLYLVQSATAVDDISVSVTSSVDSVKAGEPFYYDIAVSYTGSLPAQSIQLTTRVTFGTQILSIEGAGTDPLRTPPGESKNVSMQFYLADMPAGSSSRTVRVHVRAGFSGAFRLASAVDAAVPDSVSGNNFSFTDVSATLPDDLDQDHLPDWWEQANDLSIQISTGDHGPDGDLDKDGVSNYHEFVADTKANDADSKLRLEYEKQPNGDTVISFRSSSIREYRRLEQEWISQVSSPNDVGNGYDGIIVLETIADGSTANLFYTLQAVIPGQ